MYVYRLILILVLAIYYFSPAIFSWWLAKNEVWYQPFLLWGGVIGAVMLLHLSLKNKEPDDF